MKELQAAGAKVLTPARDVPGLPKAGFVQDPFGVKIELLQDPEALGFHHIHLRVPDPEASLKWSVENFGGERMKWKGRLDAVKYTNPMVLLLAEKDDNAAPSQGRAIDHLGWAVTNVDAKVSRPDVEGLQDGRAAGGQESARRLRRGPGGVAGSRWCRGERKRERSRENECRRLLRVNSRMSVSLASCPTRRGIRPNDVLLDRFLEYTHRQRLTLYPAQEEAILELLDGKNVILNTPTGSGKSLVASALLFAALARGQRAVYTCPIKALVNEKWMGLCREFGPDHVGLSTGDATVNRDAPILCCTAEMLANIALREGADAVFSDVVMDEFHYYADRDRGVAWQVPLLTMPQARFLLMSATLGDTRFFEEAITRLNGRATVTVKSGDRPVPLEYAYSEIPLAHTIEKLVDEGKTPVYVVHFTQADAAGSAQDFTSLKICTQGAEGRDRGADRRLRVHQPLRRRHPQVAAARHRPAPRRAAPEVPRARRAARAGGPAQGDLRHGHARRRHQRADPHGAVHAPVQVRRPEDGPPERARLPPDRRARRAQGLRRPRLRRRAGAGARDREHPAEREVGARRQEGREAEAARAQLRQLGPATPSSG